MNTTVSVLQYEGPVFVCDSLYSFTWGRVQSQFPKLFCPSWMEKVKKLWL
jgi:hypothetical protein